MTTENNEKSNYISIMVHAMDNRSLEQKHGVNFDKD